MRILYLLWGASWKIDRVLSFNVPITFLINPTCSSFLFMWTVDGRQESLRNWMLNSLSPWKYVTLKPHDSCVILSASGVLMICISFLDSNLVTDKNLSGLFLTGRTPSYSCIKCLCICSNPCAYSQFSGEKVYSWSWNVCSVFPLHLSL